MRRKSGVDLDALLSSLRDTAAEPDDEVTTRILDSAAALFAEHGLRRCTMDDIAEHSGLGRTTVYRRFDGRAQVTTAVLTRECRRFFSSILLATAHLDRVEDAVVEGFLTGLASPERSLLTQLARQEPEVLALLTVESGPILVAARRVLVSAGGLDPDHPRARHAGVVAEMLVRLAISFVLEERSILDLANPEQLREDLHRLLDPLVEPLSARRSG